MATKRTVKPKKSTNTRKVQAQINDAAQSGFGLGKAVGKDAFINAPARMGLGTPSVAEGAGYELVRWSNNYWLMITMFRNHWISRRMCELPAQDMCKAWPVIKSELNPKQITRFGRTLAATLTQQRFQEAITWARLFGGAGVLPIIDGHEDILDQPLDVDEINPGTYRGLIVFDRWSGITPSLSYANDIENPIDYGMPEFYEVKSPTDNSIAMKIHHSRIMRFCGPQVPYPEKAAQLNWGISVLEPAFEEIRKRDNASWAILQLLFRAQILTQVNPQLAQLMSGLGAPGGATVGGGASQFAQQYQIQNELLSNNSMLILGKDGKLESHQYTFGGIADVLNAFETAIAGASDGIPFAKLFGKSVSGLNQTNEGDEKMWEENVARKQNEEMRPNLEFKLYPIICMSEFGTIPEDFDFDFPSIRVMTEKEKSELAKNCTEAIVSVYSANLISQRTAMMELKQLSDSTGLFSNITDDDIEQASDEIQDPMEMMEMQLGAGDDDGEDDPPAKPGKKKPGGAKKPDPKKKKKPSAKDSALVNDLGIVIETVKGDIRFGSDFQIEMPADYGFLTGTTGADGDELDCYVGEFYDNCPLVYVVNQSHIGSYMFDEHKCMIGYKDIESAKADYMAGHTASSDVFISIKPMSMDNFRQWINKPQLLPV